MSKKGLAVTSVLSIFSGIITYLIGVPYTVMFFGGFYCLMGIFLLTNKDTYIKIKKIINIDSFEEYNKKDEEFKKYIKDNSASYILIGGVFVYLGFRMLGMKFSSIYIIAITVIVFLNYLIETYAMKTSKTWLDYKKKSGMLQIVLVFFILIFV